MGLGSGIRKKSRIAGNSRTTNTVRTPAKCRDACKSRDACKRNEARLRDDRSRAEHHLWSPISVRITDRCPGHRRISRPPGLGPRCCLFSSLGPPWSPRLTAIWLYLERSSNSWSLDACSVRANRSLNPGQTGRYYNTTPSPPSLSGSPYTQPCKTRYPTQYKNYKNSCTFCTLLTGYNPP